MNFRKVLPLAFLALALLAPVARAVGVSMEARFAHTTTLLPDGNILIAGGVYDTATVTNSVEMYDMKSNTYINWAGANALDTARSSHTATLMSDGRVLIAGGFLAGGTPTATLEICNPATRACAAIGATMNSPRGGHTATLLSKGPRAGQVLLCGGQSAAAANTITPTCDTFNPVGEAITNAAAMLSARVGHAAVLLQSGSVFATGGKQWNGAWAYNMQNDKFDPYAAAGAGLWTPVSALLQGRIDHTATVLNNGKILIGGGYNGDNGLRCTSTDPLSMDEDCWHIRAGMEIAHDVGTQGYLASAEFFDQNGARVELVEKTFGEFPYRTAGHAALLKPDGRWQMFGGYGNIFPTFFSDTPKLDDQTIINLSTVTVNTATVDNTSAIRFPLKLKLVRAVSGRLVNADAFISGPPADYSFTIGKAKFILPSAEAAADASPVGTLLGSSYKPGDFYDTLQLRLPLGTAEFEKHSVTSGVLAPLTYIQTSTLTSSTLFPEVTAQPISGSLLTPVALTVPKFYRKIIGTARILAGTIVDDAGIYSIAMQESGSGAFSVAQPSTCDKDNCVFTTTIAFTGLSGIISNLTSLADGTTVYFPLEASGDQIQLSMELTYAAGQVSALDSEPLYDFSQSTMVVRGMVFSSQLSYSPAANTWSDLSDTEQTPPLVTPSFNHTALLTPAADIPVLGGRNCEAIPDVDCLRANMRFSTAAATTIFVPVYAGSDGTATWPEGQKLNSRRAFHTSTLLPDGRVLTCGGSDGAKNLDTCELLDTVTRKWTPTGSMNLRRANHTATLLPNGNVLVAGGIAAFGVAISSAEIFYPDTQRWVPTSSMVTVRQLHTATLMPDGNVLIAGGATPGAYANSAEIFISSNNAWVSAGAMVNGRSQHTATLLKNGNILFAGGVNGTEAMRQTELFNYLTRTFAAGPLLNTARYAHTATQLRDGNVIAIGGSDSLNSLRTSEIYNGTNWQTIVSGPDPILLNFDRANHRSVLLPNGKIMLTGGEYSGVAQSVPESFDPDFQSWAKQGLAAPRTHHTSLITKDNLLMNIGGWSGANYLDTTELVHFNMYPDMNGLQAETTRQALISTGTVYFNQADAVTLMSGTSNFHGITEASGGGAGSANSSFSNPRVYLQQMDNASGFMLDISTRIYSLYGGVNSNWERTLSSITVTMPSAAGELPHGWYHMRTAAAGVFSDAHTVQVTIPRPAGAPSVATGTVLGISSITWSWNRGGITAADGYAIYSASNSVFIATVAYVNDNSTIFYTQTGMIPNTRASIMLSAYNLCGSGPLSRSATYYTLAAVPTPVAITAASFETASLEWTRNANSDLTIYEVSMSPRKTPQFSSGVDISTPIPLSVSHTSTSTVITQLSANQMYDFRVRAMNGAGLLTGFTNIASTITVGSVSNFTGQALSSYTINWSWDASPGADYYELYDVTGGTTAAVFIGSTTESNLSQTGLSANYRYYALARAVNDTDGPGPIYGPLALAPAVYTLTVQPLPGTPNVFTNVSTGSLTINWIPNGNSTWTVYNLTITVATNTSSFQVTGSSKQFQSTPANIYITAAVTPVNGDGIPGTTVSLGSKYTTASVPPSLVVGAISMSGIELSWDTSANSPATIYEVRSSTSDTFAAPVRAHVAFSSLYTDNYALAGGLLTGTSYYFDVAACNGEGILLNCTGVGVTARKRAPAAFTIPGPGGAPAGSIGGTSNPAQPVTIDGFLPNNRRVTMNIPAGAFPTATTIAISSSAENKCGYLAGGLLPIEVAIFSQNGSQPEEPITLTLRFDQDPTLAKNDIINKASQVVLARYNPVSGQCLPLETKVNIGDRTITATLNHFSLFQLMVRTAASDLSNVLIYPNPFYMNRGQGFITLDRLPANSKVRVYTLSGDKVWEATAGSTGMVIWKGVNKSGNLVASGIYLAVVDSSAGKKVFKLAVER